MLRSFIRLYLYIPFYFQKLSKTGSFEKGRVEMVREKTPATGNPLKRALWKHYVRQYHEASCSVASVATVVNALGEVINGQAGEISQRDLLDQVKTANWKKRMSPEGDNGKRGLPLALFGDVVKDSLETFQIPYSSIETIDPLIGALSAGEKREAFRNRLQEFETLGNGLIIAHFNQGAFIPDLNIPHISPVGGYDDRTDRVTVLDVDQLQSAPYSIPFERFYLGISKPYHLPFRLLGLNNGGYIYIKL